MNPTAAPLTADSSSHLVTFPFPLQHSEGGLTSVFLNEAKIREGLTFLTTDEAGFDFGKAVVQPVDPCAVDMGKVYERWFGYKWNILFDTAFTQLPQEILREMYAAEISTHEIGTVEHLIDYCERLGPGRDVDLAFSDRYRGPLNQALSSWRELQSGRGELAVNFTDVFWYPDLVRDFGPKIRSEGGFSSCHLHTSVSSNLHRSEFGIGLLSALSEVDAVYVHAEEYGRRLQSQFNKLQLKIPPIRRFDLGADVAWIDNGLNQVNAGNYATHPGFSGLSDSQKELVHQVFASRETVPHRFICIDRIEPTKGVHTVLSAVDRFLSERAADGEDLKANYRFFFLHELMWIESYDRLKPKDQYVRLVKEEHQRLAEKYPGVVMACLSLKGAARDLIPSMGQGCHGINGAVEDGLGLTSAELPLINAKEDTALVSGNGSGFALEAERRGFADGAYFVQSGAVEKFSQAFHRIVTLQRTAPGTLAERKYRLVQDFILPRRDSVAVDR